MAEREETGRRKVVVGTLGLLASALLAGLGYGMRDPPPAHAQWDARTRDRWQLLGRAYLRLTPAEASAETLTTLLLGDSRLALEDKTAVLARLRALARDDFRLGRTTNVEGWLLAVTEARIAALVSLHSWT